MKVRLILIVAAGALLGTLAMAPPAEAGHRDWSLGVGFHVGGLDFRIGFAPPGYGHHQGPFFVTGHRLHHRGYSCNGACFRRGPSFYHHASCPLLGFHLRHIGYGPDYFLSQYAPYGYWGPPAHRRHYRPNRSYGYYYRHGYRDRHYRPGGRHYRDRHRRDRHYRDQRNRDRHYRDHRNRDRRYRDQRGRRDYDDDSDSDSDRRRQYRDDRRQQRRRDGGRDYAQPRRGARQTRPPS